MNLSELLHESTTPSAVAERLAAILNADTPACVLLIGLPASGKSTLVDRVQRELNVRVPVESTDELAERDAREAGLTYGEFMKKHRERVMSGYLATVRSNVAAHVAAKQSFMVDQTLLKPDFRKEYLEMVPRGWVKVGVIFTVNPRTLDRRLATRAERTGKSIPPEVIETMRKGYVPPAKAEGFTELLEVTG